MATIRDIARMTGVSASTISRVLNEHPEGLSIPEDIRQLIFQTAEELNYVKATGKRRRVGKNKIGRIAVLGWGTQERDLEIPYYALIRRGINAECRALGLDSSSVVFEWSDLIRTYSSLLQYDGVIVIGQIEGPAEYFKDKGQRVVFIDHCPDALRFNSVIPDLAHGTTQALSHLLSIGYTNIGYLGGENEGPLSLPRYKSFKKLLGSKGLYNEDFVHLAGDWTAKTGYAMAQNCVRQGRVAEAYFVANDPMAVGALNAFLDAGLRIPEDVAIVGFDDIEMASYVRPSLTTVRLPAEILGRYGVDLLVNGLSDNSIPVSVSVPTELVIRDSCGMKLKNMDIS
ncbi:LacI family DNA-binding transcriptional regulator [Alicyclobacillus fastidiosus]|uniref:LacI family DNA-binding transcriptional regulator n=1 Tax=Alicyclobacillus fastidiosus TaxID=392011 RepID=A0ABY6ZB37_9BACL|nr:LacI family DNA-binding transcriptional regulator [Alicyclobacillus fastidiosus]WAH40052.1 LacI family DNA-binding transcriptional regulator [Alicyclobacillus fastidiosus]GMA61358.1 putative HTH-type transcriptional regulator MsmR [Alicyclobacillus fastidiosus]